MALRIMESLGNGIYDGIGIGKVSRNVRSHIVLSTFQGYLLTSSPKKKKLVSVQFEVVTGSHIHFWDDMWCSDAPFLERMGLFIGIFILLILSRNGSWRVYNLSLLYCIPLNRNGVDKMVWKPTKNGSFDVKLLS